MVDFPVEEDHRSGIFKGKGRGVVPWIFSERGDRKGKFLYRGHVKESNY